MALLKPCAGSFSPATQEILRTDKDRAQWHMHRCEICNHAVEGQEVNGRWVPVKHWPSVNYPSINRRSETRITRV